ncbi:MAG: GntR family transcriptional regulator [Kiritimatiellae bacterium]|nr:GntR family transcriptional regulator [Kiritimatiellia bacterium]
MRLVRTLPEGAKVPTVRALMRQFGVSQLLVSQALLLLRERGYLSAHVGRGTFVTACAANLPVLWVCGTDVYHGQISSFWGHCFSEAEVLFRERGVAIDPVWLSNFRPHDCAPYLDRMVLDQYRGFVFLGCAPEHPLLKRVRDGGKPFVRLTYEGPDAHEVAGNREQMLATAMARCRDLGHRTLTILAPDDCGFWNLVWAVAPSHGLRVSEASHKNTLWARDAKRAGYETAKRLFAERSLKGAILITDEVLAAGATRAMLECCTTEQLNALHVIVTCAMQEMAPFGLPLDFVVFDVKDVVLEALNILRRQWERAPGPDRHAFSFRLVLSKDAARVAAEHMARGSEALETAGK